MSFWKEKRKENEMKRRTPASNEASPGAPGECLLEYCLRMEQVGAGCTKYRVFDMHYADFLLDIGRCGSHEDNWEQDMNDIDWWWTIVLTGVNSKSTTDFTNEHGLKDRGNLTTD
jgi:hypothetical protein